MPSVQCRDLLDLHGLGETTREICESLSGAGRRVADRGESVNVRKERVVSQLEDLLCVLCVSQGPLR